MIMIKPEQHTVYLAVPGRNFCWGTVTGVAKSTSKHVALPFNGGFGFSGTEDFNVLWTDAQNLFEQGRVTHFAMLHGDITPDAGQYWLDVLLEEMDRLGASLVSAISPIKDGRGLTSSGICDMSDPWRPFRRFTVREVFAELPETFDNVGAGYPDRPLLHNTGLWVCDLRRPEFRAVREDGTLDLYFAFPTRAVRDADGKWVHQRESEDWHFSRDLWLRGVRDTYITSKVRLQHHGGMTWGTHQPWGTFEDGDENTEDKWRAELLEKPLALAQILQFELGSDCNLGDGHLACPNRDPDRWARLDTGRELDDDTIVSCAVRAYGELGFTGLVGWAYYNEPLLQADRMFRLMERIKADAPMARFILWTNGTLVPEDCAAFADFEQIVLSGYNADSRRGLDRLTAEGIAARWIEYPLLDNRLVRLDPDDADAPCFRPFVEFVLDAYGNTHFCCYDWRGEGTWGNVHASDFAELARRWRDMLPKIAGARMVDDAPAVCRECGHRWSKYQQHDAKIVNRARNWRAGLCSEP